MNRYNVGEISKLFGISKQALRYYDKINLIKPLYTDPKTGYRYYEYSQFYQLGLIISLKQTGVSLEHIKEYLKVKDIGVLKDILLEQEEILNKQLRSISDMKESTAHLIDYIDKRAAFKKDSSQETYGLKKIDQRKVIEVNVEFKISDLYDCIKLVNQFVLISNKARGEYVKGEIVLTINKDNLVSRHFDIYSSIGSLIHCDSSPDTDKTLTAIDENLYAYTYHFGSYSSLPKTYDKLVDYIESNAYKINGNSVEIGRITIFHTDDPNNFITEIQIPVEKKETL